MAENIKQIKEEKSLPEINKRIIELINSKNMKPSEFADFLKVKRPRIAHIIVGRNKPNIDFIALLMDKFPDLNPEWLLLGKGNMFKDQPKNEVHIKEPMPNTAINPQKPEILTNPNTDPTSNSSDKNNIPSTYIEKHNQLTETKPETTETPASEPENETDTKKSEQPSVTEQKEEKVSQNKSRDYTESERHEFRTDQEDAQISISFYQDEKKPEPETQKTLTQPSTTPPNHEENNGISDNQSKISKIRQTPEPEKILILFPDHTFITYTERKN